MLQDKEISYAHAWADVFIPSFLQGAQQAGGRSLKLASTAGSLDGLKRLANNQVLLNAAWNFNQEYWEAADVLFRLALNKKPNYKNYKVFVRAFTPALARKLPLTTEAERSGQWFGKPSLWQNTLLKTWSLR
jgi:ribose transport system substrate-binding protein